MKKTSLNFSNFLANTLISGFSKLKLISINEIFYLVPSKLNNLQFLTIWRKVEISVFPSLSNPCHFASRKNCIIFKIRFLRQRCPPSAPSAAKFSAVLNLVTPRLDFNSDNRRKISSKFSAS